MKYLQIFLIGNLILSSSKIFSGEDTDISSSSSSTSCTASLPSSSSSISSTSGFTEELLQKKIGKRIVDLLKKDINTEGAYEYHLSRREKDASTSFKSFINIVIMDKDVQKFDDLLKIFLINGYLPDKILKAYFLDDKGFFTRNFDIPTDFLKIFLKYSESPIEDINRIINSISHIEGVPNLYEKAEEQLKKLRKDYQEYLDYKEQLFGKGKKLSKQILESTPVPTSISDIITGYAADLSFDEYMAMKEKENKV